MSEALRFTIDEVRSQTQGPESVRLELCRRPFPPDPRCPVLPMRIPQRLRVVTRGSLIGRLRRASGRLAIGFEPGHYQLPLGSGPACEVELSEKGQAFLRFEVGEAVAGRGAEPLADSLENRTVAPPVLQAADLHFSPPVAILNVAQTLGELHGLVEDRLLVHLKPLRPRLPDWFADLGGLALGSTDVAATVLLEHVQARATLAPEPLLRISFSGRVRWFDQLEIPFERVVLPGAVLPVPFASLERLISKRPLSTAEVVEPLHDPLGLLTALEAAFRDIEGEVTLEIDPPPLSVSTRTIDGIELEGTLRSPGHLRVRGSAQGRSSNGAGVSFHAERLEVAPATATVTMGQTAPALALAVDGKLRLDLDPDERRLSERFGLQLDVDVLAGSGWPELLVGLHSQQPLWKGESTIPLRLERLRASGGVRLSTSTRDRGLEVSPTRPFVFSGDIESRGPILLQRSSFEVDGHLESGSFTGALTPRPQGPWEVQVDLEARLRGELEGRMTPIPELNLHQGQLGGELAGKLSLGLRAELALQRQLADFKLDPTGSRLAVELDRFAAELDKRRLTLPGGSLLSGRVIGGSLSAAGPGPCAVELSWDLQGEPCLLHHEELAVSLLSPDLRRGNLVLQLDHTGKLGFSGQRDSFYGVRYFNALLNPAGDPAYLQDLLRSDDAVAHVEAALQAFNPELAELLTDLQALWRAGETILKREGIREPRDFIPRQAMCRVFSRLLTGGDRLRQRLVPIVKGATEGAGLDLAAAREMLQQELGEFDIDYEVGFALKWLDLVLSPAEMLDPPRLIEEPPLALNPAYDEARRNLPTAAEIYQVVEQGQLDEGWLERLAELAPRLTRNQLGYVLKRVVFDTMNLAASQETGQETGQPAEALSRLHYVYDIKGRVEEIAEGYGGVEYALQPFYIASFLGEAVGPLPGINTPSESDGDWPPRCALGPEEVAHLLQAGLAWGRQDGQTQLNNRLLLALLRREAPAFTREVLIELGRQSPRALSGVLYAFLAQDQDQMAKPIDLVQLLEEKLGAPVPRQTDYMAGGRKARESYYEALSRLADTIIEESAAYLSAKAHLQQVRHPVAPEVHIEPSLEKLEQRARDSIARADEQGGQCGFDGNGRGGPRQRSRDTYRRAFRACARLLEKEPRAFQLDWFKDFWLRNEEALRVLSVVRGHQEDRDDDRRWLAVQTGREGPIDPKDDTHPAAPRPFAHEQELLETVVNTLYWEESHRKALLGDPLVRLLIDPEPGRLAFSIVSCMGVITEGKDGAELEKAYERLERRRGVHIIRAHTATARSLEFNARRIIEAVETSTTPFGLIGYSQGCANALLAESMLYTGTPDERRLVEGLVCRKLIFSAANGSAHGTCGMLKFRRAMVLGERYLKHYQAVMSREAVEAVLGALKGVLDSRLFIAVLGGADSLTYEAARELHRDGQFLDHVPTSYTRGVVTEDRLPETLEYLYYMLREQTGAGLQDTQVLITDAVGHSTRVRNAYTRVLERCDMGALPQATHHWAPLTREVEFVTTERDLERAVYMSPKDRLVWPWVEVNARFGRIKPA
jgi:hypothetical protein